MTRSSRDKDNNNQLLDVLISHDKAPNYAVNRMNKKRLAMGFGLLLLIFLLLILRMGWIQIVSAEKYKEKATAIQTLDTDVASTRGTIFDAKGNIMAETVMRYELYGYTEYLYKSSSIKEVDKERNVQKLAKLTGKSEEEITKRLKGDENLVLLGDSLTQDQIKQARKIWGDSITVKTKSTRYYPNGAFAAQILGGVSDEGEGLGGLERSYNTQLSGRKGRTVKVTDGTGNTLSSSKSKNYKPEDGYNIETTIDCVIQQYVEDALVKGMQRTGASKITCIVTNPKTGDIVAYAQTPEYDPNHPYVPIDSKQLADFKKGSAAKQNEILNEMWQIEAVTDVYEPGSTFKLVASSAGLELGSVTDGSRYYCNGTINVDGTVLHCTGVHGTQDIKVAVGNSCNPALAKVALTMGAEGYYRYIKLYGLMNKTGVDLPYESGSIVKDKSTLTGVDLATMGYGQGIAVTPIQLLMAVNAMGNDGVLMKPKVVKKITDAEGNTVKEFGNIEVRQVITKETADRMRDIMEYYVTSAGGTKAYVPGYRVGGKTGTANIATGGGYSASTDTSFIAMAPMDDPVLSMLVIVHKPTKMSYGNNTAGPIIKEIMSKSLPYLGVEKQSSSAAVSKTQVIVPSVTGIDSSRAISLLKSKGLGYKIMPKQDGDKSFVVQDQYPKAGAKTDKGGTVYIYRE